MKTFEFVLKCSIKFYYFSSNGGCQDCKVYQGLFVFTVQVQGWSCWCRSWPISATYHTNIGLAVTVIFIFGLGRCSCGLFWPHTKQSAQVKKTALSPPCLPENLSQPSLTEVDAEDNSGERCWSSPRPENHLWLSPVWTTTGDVWVLLCPLQNLIRGHFQKSSYGCSKQPSELNVSVQIIKSSCLYQGLNVMAWMFWSLYICFCKCL